MKNCSDICSVPSNMCVAVVAVFALKTVPIPAQYLLTSVPVQLTRTISMATGQLPEETIIDRQCFQVQDLFSTNSSSKTIFLSRGEGTFTFSCSRKTHHQPYYLLNPLLATSRDALYTRQHAALAQDAPQTPRVDNRYRCRLFLFFMPPVQARWLDIVELKVYKPEGGGEGSEVAAHG